MTEILDQLSVANCANTDHFFDDAIPNFGMEGTAQIWNTLQGAVRTAQNSIPIEGIPSLKLVVGTTYEGKDIRTLTGIATPWQARVTICLDPRASVNDISYLLPEYVHHEYGHIAHYQLSPEFYQLSQHSLFRFAVREGLGRHVGRSVYPGYFPRDMFTKGHILDDKKERQIIDELIEILFNPPENDSALHEEFLWGDATFPRKAYVIGHWLVAQKAVRYKMNFRQLMELSISEWREFAEKEV